MKTMVLSILLVIICALTSITLPVQAASSTKTTKVVEAPNMTLSKAVKPIKIAKSSASSGVAVVYILKDAIVYSNNHNPRHASYKTKISNIKIDGKITKAYKYDWDNPTVNEAVVSSNGSNVYKLVYTRYVVNVAEGRHTITVTAGGKTVSQSVTITSRYKAPRIGYNGYTLEGNDIKYDFIRCSVLKTDTSQYATDSDSGKPEFYVLKGRTLKKVIVTEYRESGAKTFVYKSGKNFQVKGTEKLRKSFYFFNSKMTFTKYVLNTKDCWAKSYHMHIDPDDDSFVHTEKYTKIKITVVDNTGAKTTYTFNANN